MLKVGDHVVLKSNLVLGRKYGTVTFGKYHVPYLHKVLKVYNISSTGTAYCSHKGYPCECGTFSEPMLNVAKFHIGEHVRVIRIDDSKRIEYVGLVSEVKGIDYNSKDGFIYHLKDDCGFFDWKETDLETHIVDKDLEELSVTLEDDENQLQGKDSNIRSGEGVKGSRVHGRLSQASVRSRPLRDAKSVRGK